MLASKAMTTIVWMGCWQAMPEIDNSVEETWRLSQLSLFPSERNCLGRREEPRMLNGGKRRCLRARRVVGRQFEVVFYRAIGSMEPVLNALNELQKSAKCTLGKVDCLQESKKSHGHLAVYRLDFLASPWLVQGR